MSGGIPVTITNSGVAITNTVGGAPVTLVGGSAAAITDTQAIDMTVDGEDKTVTFTVVDGVITAITTT